MISINSQKGRNHIRIFWPFNAAFKTKRICLLHGFPCLYLVTDEKAIMQPPLKTFCLYLRTNKGAIKRLPRYKYINFD